MACSPTKPNVITTTTETVIETVVEKFPESPVDSTLVEAIDTLAEETLTGSGSTLFVWNGNPKLADSIIGTQQWIFTDSSKAILTLQDSITYSIGDTIKIN